MRCRPSVAPALRRWSLCLAIGWLLAAPSAGPAHARDGATAFTPPEILLLGDSQISFGAGEVLTAFFGALDRECADALSPAQATQLRGRRLGVIGARQTSLRAWSARSGRAKWLVCGKDPTWGVNASTFGVLRSEKRGKYEQIGETPGTQFCAAGRSPFEEMFRPGYYDPTLLVMWFLGNDAARWARDPAAAAEDVARLTAQLPPDTPCVFMTTAPSYRAGENRRRVAAQDAVMAAFARAGGRCATAPGLTPETIAALEGMPAFYRRHEDGRVKDPYHPLRRGAAQWLALRKGAICEAVATALEAGDADGPPDDSLTASASAPDAEDAPASAPGGGAAADLR
jgi:hypothetical protein